MKIIIVGAYAIGTHLARLLSRNNEDITLIDEDEERLAQIGNDCDLLTMNASPSSINTLMDAGVAHTSLFIAVTPSQSLNLNTCIIAHALGAKKTVAKINDAEFIADEKKQFFRKLGVDELIYPEVLAARDIINGLKMSWVRQRWDVHDGALVMLGVKLRETCTILDRPLRELCGPDDPVCLLASLCAVSAIDAGETRTVIGADLTDEQVKTVYKTFGIERGSVKELTVTNKDERQYLSGVISDAQIGTKSISCISIEVLEAGKGMTVATSHITYCTSQMYISALATAGITDAKISVAAPFDVSGTAALTGVYKAYEDITGTKLDETAKAVSSQELATTAELAQAIGDYDSVEIVNELKLILNETKDMTDAELRAKIREIAAEYNVTLTDDQMTQLVNLCRSLEKLDTNALLSKVQAVQDTLKQLAGAKDKVASFTGKVKDVITAIGDFFDRVIAFFRK